MNKVKIGDVQMTEKHIEMVLDIAKSGQLTEGKYSRLLEKEMQDYLGVKHAILVTNGTVSLQLIGQYLTHTRGKSLNVCVPAMTFPATINAFLITGHNVSLCDIGEDLQIDISTLSDSEKKAIDVIVPVHLMGYAADMESICSYDWTVVEDTAESFGTLLNGRKAGTFGDFGSFSFYVTHNIWAGELGMVTTNDDDAAIIMRSMKNHGRMGDSMKFLHSYVGSNYKTTEFMAGIGYVNLTNATEIIDKRRNNAQFFVDSISNPKLTPFPVDNDFSPLGYPILCESEEFKDHIVSKLNQSNVETRGIFPSLANQVAYKGMYETERYPVANRMEKTVFYIGIHQYLTQNDLDLIVNVLNNN
jgi:perosamine synthetase